MSVCLCSLKTMTGMINFTLPKPLLLYIYNNILTIKINFTLPYNILNNCMLLYYSIFD